MHSRGFDLCRIQTNVVAPSANTPVAVDDYPGGARGPVLGAAALGVATYGVAKWREGYPGGTITPNSPGPGGSPMPGVAALGVATLQNWEKDIQGLRVEVAKWQAQGGPPAALASQHGF
jgi:hypothetical protein